MPPLIGAWAAWITRGILERPQPLQIGRRVRALAGGLSGGSSRPIYPPRRLVRVQVRIEMREVAQARVEDDLRARGHQHCRRLQSRRVGRSSSQAAGDRQDMHDAPFARWASLMHPCSAPGSVRQGPYAVDAVAEIRHRPDRSRRQSARPVADGFRPGSGRYGRLGKMLMESTLLRMSPDREELCRLGETRGKVTSLISQFMKVGGTGD